MNRKREPLKVPLGVHESYVPLDRVRHRSGEENILDLFWETMAEIKKDRAARAFSRWLGKEKDHITRTKQNVTKHGAGSEIVRERLLLLISQYEEFRSEREMDEVINK